MDGKEGMGLSGSPPYYLNRGFSGSGPNPGSFLGSGTQPGLPAPPGFKNLSNPSISIQTNVRDSHVGSSYQVENPSPNFGHGINMGVASGDPVTGKKKRGRPRKYGPDGANMSLALSPMSSNPSPGSITPVEKKNRGRPRGSGRKQQLASLGNFSN